MIRELHTNRLILDGLVNCYGMFLFTGGDVPRSAWGLTAIGTYLQRPLAADRVSTGDVQRYRDLAEAIMRLGESLAEARPRTLRCRKAIADTFDGASSEIRELGSALEAVLT